MATATCELEAKEVPLTDMMGLEPRAVCGLVLVDWIGYSAKGEGAEPSVRVDDWEEIEIFRSRGGGVIFIVASEGSRCCLPVCLELDTLFTGQELMG